MAEAAAVRQLESSITSLVYLSAEVVSRLRDFTSKTADVPGSFQSLAMRLPSLTATLKTLQAQVKAQYLSSEVVIALIARLESTTRQLSIVQTFLASMLPPSDGSRFTRRLKALKTVGERGKIQIAVRSIHQDIDYVVLHYTPQHTDAHDRNIKELSQLHLTPSQVSQRSAGHQYPHVSVFGSGVAHLGDSHQHQHEHHHYQVPTPRQLTPRTKKLGVCLNSASKIDAFLFQGRAADLEEMRLYLEQAAKSPGRRSLVLGGVGGIGKTQLALMYADRCRDLYDSVLWLNATSEVTLNLSFREIAELIFQGQDFHSFEDGEILVAVRQWLSDLDNQRWLVIYDNYDEPDLYNIEKYYPSVDHGSVIITTRLPDRVQGRQVRVRPLQDVKESLAILQTRSQRSNIESDRYALQLADRLAGLPLALATAGAYLKTSALTFQQYLEEYDKRWNINPRMLTQLPEYKDRTLYTAWNLSYTQLQTQHPDAAQLLKLLAYFDNQKLWYGLFVGGLTGNSPKGLHALSEELDFENLMSILAGYCFVEAHVTSQSYSMHSCVHDWTLAALNKTINAPSYWYAFDCVVALIDKKDKKSLGHVSYSTVTAHAARLAHDHFSERALRGKRPRDSFGDMSLVARLLRKQVQLVAAEKMYMRALAGKEKALGPDHTSTLSTVNNLGLLYADQGKLDKAEEVYMRALAGYEKALGPDHTSTLQIKCNLEALGGHQRMEKP